MVKGTANNLTRGSNLFEAFNRQLERESRERNKKLAASKEWVQLQEEFKKRSKHVCKPCWELKYCPYGPLVEQFPLEDDRDERACRIFGHNCPVFWNLR